MFVTLARPLAVAAAVAFWAAPVSAQKPAPCAFGFSVPFQPGRANLNNAAINALDEAVERARQCSVGSVVVSGPSEKSDPVDNPGLSERRASVVAFALVARGIPESAITTKPRTEPDPPPRPGESEPAVAVLFQ